VKKAIGAYIKGRREYLIVYSYGVLFIAFIVFESWAYLFLFYIFNTCISFQLQHYLFIYLVLCPGESRCPSIAPQGFGRIFSLVAYGIATVVIAMGLFILALHFISLYPEIPGFRVDSDSLNSLGKNGTKLNVEWDIKFVVSKQDFWHRFSYDNVSVEINYADDPYPNPLTTSLLTPFSLGMLHDKINHRVKLNATGIDVGVSRETINFGIRLFASIKINGMLNYHRNRQLYGYCEPLVFMLSPESSNWIFRHGLTCKLTAS